jgi:hypothetical protein
MDPLTGILIGGGLTTASGLIGSEGAARANRRNIRFQRELAQNSVRYRVDDAIRSGINPLAALGVSTISPSVPIQSTSQPMANSLAQIGQSFNQMGQIAANHAITQDPERNNLEKQLLQAQIFDLQGQNKDALFTKKLQNNPNLPKYGEMVWWPTEAAQNAEGMIPGGMVLFGNTEEFINYIGSQMRKNLQSNVDKGKAINQIIYETTGLDVSKTPGTVAATKIGVGYVKFKKMLEGMWEHIKQIGSNKDPKEATFIEWLKSKN